MPQLVTNEKRKYTRLAHTPIESRTLSSKGFRPVVSSNVSGVAYKGDDLIIRFHGGATYEYPGSGDRYEDILNAPSKGKWVWRELRLKGVPYNKIGNVDLENDVEDRDLMREDAEEPNDITDFLTTMISAEQLLKAGFITDLSVVMLINANAFKG